MAATGVVFASATVSSDCTDVWSPMGSCNGVNDGAAHECLQCPGPSAASALPDATTSAPAARERDLSAAKATFDEPPGAVTDRLAKTPLALRSGYLIHHFSAFSRYTCRRLVGYVPNYKFRKKETGSQKASSVFTFMFFIPIEKIASY